MKKRLLSLIMILLLSFWTIPLGNLFRVNAQAMSNAQALTPFVYKTGNYKALSSLTLYTSYDGTKSTGKTVPKDTTVSVTSVCGEFGKTSYSGTVGWINLSYACNTQNKVDITARLDMLRKKFPAGMYWNREDPDVNNADGYTDVPCPQGHTDKRDNRFDGTGQCHGFAIKLGYDLFGMHASCWERHYDVDKVMVGDLVRYRGRHTVMITGVYSTYFTVADCNWDYSCNIEWDRKMNRSYISFVQDYKNDGVYHCPINCGSVTSASTTTTTTASSSKYTLTTTIFPNVTCKAILAKSANEVYYADGVAKDGKTSFTFSAPTGTYPELVLVADGYNEYCISNFTLGKDSLPATVTLTKASVTTQPLKITKQPSDVTVKSGTAAAFSVEASGSGLKYQWYFKKTSEISWSKWNGMTAASIKVTSNDTWNGMQVRCIVTDGSGATATSATVKVTLIPAIVITKQPSNVYVKTGAVASFSIEASGSGLSYQWYFKKSGATSWSKWTGKTTASIRETSNDSWEGMQVRCKVSNSSGSSVTSSTVKVTLVSALQITQQPASVSVKSGAPATFTVKASGTGLSYQWYYKKAGAASWSKWTGRTASTFQATANDTWNGMQVRCVVSDITGASLTSSTASVALIPALRITQQPVNVSVKSGALATFTIKASGSGLKYQWYYKKAGATSWTKWTGRTLSTFQVTANDTWNGMQVRCIVSDITGASLTSSTVTVTLISALRITQQLVNVSIKSGALATFSIKASGSGLKYQWYFKKAGATSWTKWTGRTASTFQVTANDTWNGMQVRCIVSDITGTSVTSSIAKVALIPALCITQQPVNVSVKSGALATFTIKASGSGLKYQWYFKKAGATSWTKWTGRTVSTLQATANDTWEGMQVRCIVTDITGDSVTSTAVKVTLIPILRITQQPVNVSVKSGALATFTIKASGSGLKYQWYYKKAGAASWSLWTGRTAPSR